MDRSDAELLRASSAGSADAYSVFFRRYVGAITRYAVRRCPNPDDVADLVGECFLVALQAAHRYVPETDTALPWLFGISRRLLAKQRRKYAGNRRLEVKVGNAFPAFTAAEDDEVASAIDAARQAPILEQALGRLTRSEREVLELVAYDGLSPTEAAVALDITPNAARLRLSRARRAVRAHLDSTAVVGAAAEDAGYVL
ncbi:MAG: RNA polymerase sigma factor [Acidimicrobiia bacterium]